MKSKCKKQSTELKILKETNKEQNESLKVTKTQIEVIKENNKKNIKITLQVYRKIIVVFAARRGEMRQTLKG